VWVEQAIFTSLPREGKEGYHVVARSPGVSDAEAVGLATWSPSHGALVVDAANRTSLNFHPLPGGRFALGRTCEGPAEYSGRGGRQLYTHVLILELEQLKRAGGHPIVVYRDALALGHLNYRPEPKARLQPVDLCDLPRRAAPSAWADRARGLGLPPLEPLRSQLLAGQSLKVPHAGDRIALAECLLGPLPAEALLIISFATSLQPSVVRPYRLLLLGTSDPS
jgi:hypothetical protein